MNICKHNEKTSVENCFARLADSQTDGWGANLNPYALLLIGD